MTTEKQPTKERLVLRLIRESADELGLKFVAKSGGWIVLLTDPKTNKTKYIWGYSFGLNSQSTAMICNDKPSLSDALKERAIPHIEHRIFLNPELSEWTPPRGTFGDLFAYAEQFNYDVVLKPKDGTGGTDVFHCKTRQEIEAAAIKLFKKSYGLAASPYEKISAEYRVVVLNSEPRLIFRKDRPTVIGDGVNTLEILLSNACLQNPQYFSNLIGSDTFKPADLKLIPQKGEVVPVLWKHNLQGGATATTDMDEHIKSAVMQLALQTVEAIDAKFVSVDIVAVGGSYKVLEVNSGVMMEQAPLFIKDGEKIAKEIYKDAIAAMFSVSPQAQIKNNNDSFLNHTRSSSVGSQDKLTPRPQFSLNQAVWTFTAGSISRLAELPVGHVLERIRVWLNVNPTKTGAVQGIYSEAGTRSFFKGIAWNTVPATMKSGTRWINTYISDNIVSRYIPADYKVTKSAVIGLIAPAITTTIYCPFETLKIRAMTRSNAEGSGVILKGLMKGWRPMYAKEAVISFTFNVCYAELLQRSNVYKDGIPTFLHAPLVGAGAGMLCATITTPLDMIKDQMQMSQSTNETRMLRATKEIYSRYGLFSLVRTMPVKMARSGWYFAATTLVMDQLNALPDFMRPERKMR